MCIWDHCVKGMEHRQNHQKVSQTRDKLDLRAHINPYDKVDVYKVSFYYC